MKMPWMKFFSGDWLKDPNLSLCSPATRGIWMDILCAMHESDRSGILNGTPEQLARVCRCSVSEIETAIAELRATKTAEIPEANGVVTLINRRMKNEAKSREHTRMRVSEFRESHGVTLLKRDRGQKSDVRSQNTEREKSESAHFSEAEIPSLEEFLAYCKSPHCGLAADFYATDKFLAAQQDNWKGKNDWRAYARRAKLWWQQDGSPMHPKKNGKSNPATRPVGGHL